jgi:hypothetical protein
VTPKKADEVEGHDWTGSLALYIDMLFA